MNVPLQNHFVRIHFGLLLAAVATAGAIAVTAVRAVSALPSPTIAAPVAVVQSQPLTQRVLPASALHGFITTQPPTTVHSAQTWAARVERSTTPAREAARLERLGFVAGVREQLHGRFPLAAEAVSVVERYRTAAGARAELAYQRAAAETGWADEHVTPLRGIAIPGAMGWIARAPHIAAVNIMFSAGREFYIVGSGAAPGTHGAPTAGQMIGAAQLENLIANGCVAKPARAAHDARQPVHGMGGPPMLLH
ncbi:MAG: hypothetical protein ACXVVQ_08040 [Solirubrobacteraceae bacterium]